MKNNEQLTFFCICICPNLPVKGPNGMSTETGLVSRQDFTMKIPAVPVIHVVFKSS